MHSTVNQILNSFESGIDFDFTFELMFALAANELLDIGFHIKKPEPFSLLVFLIGRPLNRLIPV